MLRLHRRHHRHLGGVRELDPVGRAAQRARGRAVEHIAGRPGRHLLGRVVRRHKRRQQAHHAQRDGHVPRPRRHHEGGQPRQDAAGQHERRRRRERAHRLFRDHKGEGRARRRRGRAGELDRWLVVCPSELSGAGEECRASRAWQRWPLIVQYKLVEPGIVGNTPMRLALARQLG